MIFEKNLSKLFHKKFVFIFFPVVDSSLHKNGPQIGEKSPVKRRASELKPTSASAAKKGASQIKEKSSGSDGSGEKRIRASNRAPASAKVRNPLSVILRFSCNIHNDASLTLIKDKVLVAKTIPIPKGVAKSDSKSTEGISSYHQRRQQLRLQLPKASARQTET